VAAKTAVFLHWFLICVVPFNETGNRKSYTFSVVPSTVIENLKMCCSILANQIFPYLLLFRLSNFKKLTTVLTPPLKIATLKLYNISKFIFE
jgi:hypothetical protein